MLVLRALYFMLAAFLSYFDSVNSLLAIILITIGSKIFLSAANIEVPTALFIGILTLIVSGIRVCTSIISSRCVHFFALHPFAFPPDPPHLSDHSPQLSMYSCTYMHIHAN